MEHSQFYLDGGEESRKYERHSERVLWRGTLDTNFQKRTISLFVTVIALGVLLSFLRPFGTDDLSLKGGTAYWMGLFLAGFAAIITVDILTLFVLKNLSYWSKMLICAIAVTGLVSFIVLSFHNISGWQAILLTLVQTAVISLIAIATREFLTEYKSNADTPNRNDNKNETPRLLNRLPLKLRSSIIHALKSEDHYVRVITSSGEHLLLMRLKDAITEMEPVIGIMTHRSWWVSKDGIEKLNKSGRSLTITLKSGGEALVSRSGGKLIKDAGWI